MTTPTTFSHSVRVLACTNCGGPLQVPPSGGSATCTYCGVVLQVDGRDEAAVRAAAAQAPAIDEAERFARLRGQVEHSLSLPESMAHLAIAGVLHPERVEKAMAEWREARGEVGGGGAFPVAERLFHLTVLISDHLAMLRDDERQRALLETAMELLQAPRHRQVLRGTLARNAARVGDVAAADEWLAGCNSRSDDIHVDTAWRLSKAYVCAAREDHAGVLQGLGSRVGDVPIVAGEAEACGLLRANALERTGQAQQAEEQLYAIMKRGGRGAAPLVQYLALHAELELCRESFPRAKRRLDAEIAEDGKRRVTASTSLAGPIVALVMLGGCALFALAGAVTEIAVGHRQGWGILIPALLLGGLSWVAVHFGLMGNLRRRRQHTRVYESGLDATLTVLSVVKGGKNESDQLKVWVQPAGKPPYEATCSVSLTGELAERAAAGRSLPAKVDPSERDVVAIVW
jgi:hypothetical protein